MATIHSHPVASTEFAHSPVTTAFAPCVLLRRPDETSGWSAAAGTVAQLGQRQNLPLAPKLTQDCLTHR